MADNHPKTRIHTVDESAQRKEFGGFNIGAAFYGWLVSVGIGVLLIALLGAAGSAIAFTAAEGTITNLNQDNLATIGFASGLMILIALAIAYYAGGYVAGRMSRFDGARQGLGVWLIGIGAMVLLGLAGAAFGANYNLLQQLNLPRIPVNEGNLSTGGLVTLILTLVLTLFAALAGGKVGQRYHVKIDKYGEDHTHADNHFNRYASQ